VKSEMAANATTVTIAQDVERTERFLEAERAFFEQFDLSVRTSFVEIASPRLRVRVLESGAGEPVLMLHGGGGAAGIFAPLIARLGGFRLVAPDRPGHGLTGAFSYRGVDQRRHAVDFVSSIAATLGDRPLRIVGNSMGALWALWFALEHPQRVSRLVLVGCPALILGSSGPFGYRLLGVRGLNTLMWGMEPASPKQIDRLMCRMGHDPKTVPPGFKTFMERLEVLPGYRTAYLTLLESALTVSGARSAVALGEEELRRVEQPTLLLWGTKDPFGTVDLARQASAAMPHARLEIVGQGHLPWLDEADRCGALATEFLRG
jgi:2-hydroxy-6-oxonona-2,4-dienedioate hydrolase